MKNIFLDFGSNRFQGYEKLKKKFKVDDTWEVHAYEPNPSLTEEIQSNCPKEVVFHNKAVWKANEILEFVVDLNREDWEGSHIDQGSETFYNRAKSPNKIKVESVDVYDILKKYDEQDNIIVKMDIETAEFEVLPRMIETNQMKKVNHLYVEFHCRMFGEERPKYREIQNKLIKDIENLGVKVTVWE